MLLHLFCLFFFLSPLLKTILQNCPQFPVVLSLPADKEPHVIFISYHYLYCDGPQSKLICEQHVRVLFTEPNIPHHAVSPSRSSWLAEGTPPRQWNVSRALQHQENSVGEGNKGRSETLGFTLSLTDQMALQMVKISSLSAYTCPTG